MSEQLKENSSGSPAETKFDLEDYAYYLPVELIAQNPSEKRDQSRLFYYDRQKKAVNHLHFGDICNLLKAGDILVVNNTRVIPAKLVGKKQSGGKVEFLLIKKEPDQVGVWQAMAMPIKKLSVGETIIVSGKKTDYPVLIKDIFIAADGQKRVLLDLTRDNRDQTFAILQDAGGAPLPPYIVSARNSSPDHSSESFDYGLEKNKDLERYQTIFAKEPGAVAAPTAGLHFSSDLIKLLKEKGIFTYEITLHVGPGTFKPISGDIENHVVESEWFSITPEVCAAINKGKKAGQRIIAVGTTTCRALESAFTSGELLPQAAYTSLFIKPGYKFRLIDGLVTNFHLSKSSLLLLVAALVGREQLLIMYQEAIEKRYRFFSYGDAMLIL